MYTGLYIINTNTILNPSHPYSSLHPTYYTLFPYLSLIVDLHCLLQIPLTPHSYILFFINPSKYLSSLQLQTAFLSYLRVLFLLLYNTFFVYTLLISIYYFKNLHCSHIFNKFFTSALHPLHPYDIIVASIQFYIYWCFTINPTCLFLNNVLILYFITFSCPRCSSRQVVYPFSMGHYYISYALLSPYVSSKLF